MLKVLDNLHSSDNYYLKLETENWLFHSLLRGDCCRIIEPLLLILLDYKTARIGVSYANIQLRTQCSNARMNESDVVEVFSIHATQGGAEAYHVLRGSGHSNAGEVNHRLISSMDTNVLKSVECPMGSCSSLRSNETISQECVSQEWPVDGGADVGKATTSNFDSVTEQKHYFAVGDCVSCQDDATKYGTVPLTKFFRSDKANEKRFGSYSSLETLEKNAPFRWDEESQNSDSFSKIANSGEERVVNLAKIKITRTSVSDDGLAMDDLSVKNAKDLELVRSSSFSGRNTWTEYSDEEKDRPQRTRRQEITDLLFAKTVIEEIIKEIVDQVVNGKNSVSIAAIINPTTSVEVAALAASGTKSLLVVDCIEKLTVLSEVNQVTIMRVLGYSGIQQNETTDRQE